MNKFKIAHIREQGVDLIIAPLETAFNHKSQSDQQATIASLQACAHGAGLAGTVVPVWQHGGNMKFIAPTKWHPYFRSLSWNQVIANLNKELSCG